MTPDRVKIIVKNKVNKEYRTYQNQCLEKGTLYTFNNGLKVAFYKEMRIFVINGVVDDDMFEQMNSMDNILNTLWERYSLNIVQCSGDYFLEQLIDFHCKNLKRVKARIGENS